MEGQLNRFRQLIVTMLIGLAISVVLTELARSDGKQEPGPVEASIGAFVLRIDRVIWLENQMEHGFRYPMPPSMMPDMPEHGKQRLSVQITIYNEGPVKQRFESAELGVLAKRGGILEAVLMPFKDTVLTAGQMVHIFLQYDIPTLNGQKLQLVWHRSNSERVMMLIPLPAMKHVNG